MLSKKMMVTALATAALVSPAAAPARPADQGPPPPPSSIAVSAKDDYAKLRASSGVAQDMRSPDTRDQATGYTPRMQETVDDDVSVGGFDAVSGALGLAAGIGLAIAAVALAGGLAGTRLPRRHAARS
jgi:uncharacterized protein YcfJ